MEPKPLRILKWGIHTLTIATILAAAVGAWYLRPWIKPGQTHHLGTWQFGDTHFQVWQRKNADLAEAFTTGLFVQNQGGPWHTYQLGFEDFYAPDIKLQPDGFTITVIKDGAKLGNYDPQIAKLKYPQGNSAFFHASITGPPPADW